MTAIASRPARSGDDFGQIWRDGHATKRTDASATSVAVRHETYRGFAGRTDDAQQLTHRLAPSALATRATVATGIGAR